MMLISTLFFFVCVCVCVCVMYRTVYDVFSVLFILRVT